MEVSVSGRVCLFGEHSDWAGGYRRFNSELHKGFCLVIGTDQKLFARVSPHPDKLIITSRVSSTETIGPYEIEMKPETLLEEARKGGFWSYIAGVAYQIQTFYPVKGLVIDNYASTLPIKKGLSSSAAICVLVARSFNRVYDLRMTLRAEMEMAYLGEVVTPSRCGRMDQCCAFGKIPILMVFDGDLLMTREIDVRGEIYMVIVDLMASKDTMCILSSLNKAYPAPSNRTEEMVQEYLGPINEKIVAQAVEALEIGDAARIGALMTQAQRLFDEHMTPACPSQLTAPVLHKVLNYPAIQPHIFGGKGVGAQGDGTAQFVCKSKEDREQVISILSRDLGMICLPLTLQSTETVNTAVILCAGNDNSMFPMTRVSPPPLFPILDFDSLVKPAVVLNVEEALRCGVSKVVIVVQESDFPAFSSLFHSPPPPLAQFSRLSPQQQKYSRELIEMGKKVKLVIQSTPPGLGNAILAAKSEISREKQPKNKENEEGEKEGGGEGEGEAFLLMFGDHLYKNDAGQPSCSIQLLQQFRGKSLIGLRYAELTQVTEGGVCSGEWKNTNNNNNNNDNNNNIPSPPPLLSVSNFVEKPSLSFAKSHLLPPPVLNGGKKGGEGEGGEFLMAFGMYILNEKFLTVLDNLPPPDLFDLGPALNEIRRIDGLEGVVLGGERFDLAPPQIFAETMVKWSQSHRK